MSSGSGRLEARRGAQRAWRKIFLMAIRKRILKRGTDWGYIFEGPRSTGTKRRLVAKWGFSTKKAAQDAEASRRVEERDREEAQQLARTKPRPRTLGELLAEFLEEHAQRNLAPKTVERYREMVPYLSEELRARPINEVTALELNREWNRLRDSGGHRRGTGAARPLSSKTVRNIAGLVSSAFGQGIFWGLCVANPTRDSRPPRNRRREPIALSIEQQNLLLEGSGHWQLPAILEVSAGTGARRGEVLALRWSDVHEESVFIGRSLSQAGNDLAFKEPKNGKFREIALGLGTLRALAAHRSRQEEFRKQFGSAYQARLDLVFANHDGTPLRPNSLSGSVSNLRKKLKLPPGASLHTLRHTHASQLLAAGVELPVVSARLGHSNVYVTATVYSHALKGRDEEAVKKLEVFYERAAIQRKGVQKVTAFQASPRKVVRQ